VQLAHAEGVARAGERLYRGLGDALQPLVAVLQDARQRSAGVEVEALRRVVGDLGVLLPDRFPQGVDVETLLELLPFAQMFTHFGSFP
jgi:hypothetical protein